MVFSKNIFMAIYLLGIAIGRNLKWCAGCLLISTVTIVHAAPGDSYTNHPMCRLASSTIPNIALPFQPFVFDGVESFGSFLFPLTSAPRFGTLNDTGAYIFITYDTEAPTSASTHPTVTFDLSSEPTPAIGESVLVYLTFGGHNNGDVCTYSYTLTQNLDGSFQRTVPEVYTILSSGAALDIDNDGAVMPLTDGLLLIRYLFGFSGNALISNAIGTAATRTNSAEIQTYIQDGTDSKTWDIDGNGILDPLTDGLLIIRYLFGFTGDAITDGAIGLGATRSTATAIEAYLQSLRP